jgi:predicted pyridoxine 5'-phosphate oxidase superfamily flavin-nucleotide-binding protein
MINKEMKMLIESNALALATVSEDNTPHCIAVAAVKVIGKDKLLVSDNYMGETAKNIMRDKHVSLAVWSSDWEKNCTGFELRGTAQRFTSGKWHDFVKKMPENKGMPAKAAIIVTVKKVKRLA